MKNEKLIEKIMQNPPPKDICTTELDKFLGIYGYYLDRRSDSSHYLYKNNKHPDKIITFASVHGSGKTGIVKSTYIRNIQRIIKSLE